MASGLLFPCCWTCRPITAGPRTRSVWCASDPISPQSHAALTLSSAPANKWRRSCSSKARSRAPRPESATRGLAYFRRRTEPSDFTSTRQIQGFWWSYAIMRPRWPRKWTTAPLLWICSVRLFMELGFGSLYNCVCGVLQHGSNDVTWKYSIQFGTDIIDFLFYYFLFFFALLFANCSLDQPLIASLVSVSSYFEYRIKCNIPSLPVKALIYPDTSVIVPQVTLGPKARKRSSVESEEVQVWAAIYPALAKPTEGLNHYPTATEKVGILSCPRFQRLMSLLMSMGRTPSLELLQRTVFLHLEF